MHIVRSSTLRRRAFFVDAAFSLIGALTMTFGARPLAGLSGLPQELVLGAGLFPIPYAAFVAVLGARENLPRALVWLAVVGYALWTIESLALLISDQASQATLGIAISLAQAATVAVIAELQATELEQSSALSA